MVVSIFKIVPTYDVRQELLAQVVLAERKGPIATLAVERFPVAVDEHNLELTAYFDPHSKNMTLSVVYSKQMIGHFLFHCPHPCELNFRLPSSQLIRLFCDPAQNAPRYERSA